VRRLAVASRDRMHERFGESALRPFVPEAA
jgi:hypothetical protein